MEKWNAVCDRFYSLPTLLSPTCACLCLGSRGLRVRMRARAVINAGDSWTRGSSWNQSSRKVLTCVWVRARHDVRENGEKTDDVFKEEAHWVSVKDSAPRSLWRPDRPEGPWTHPDTKQQFKRHFVILFMIYLSFGGTELKLCFSWSHSSTSGHFILSLLYPTDH